MTELFLIILNMSITAGLVIAVILLARAALCHAPRKYALLLWVPALFRLVCPVSLSSMVSVFRVGGSASPVVVDAGAMSYPGIDLGVPPAAGGTLGTGAANTVANTGGAVDNIAGAAAAAAGSAGASSITVTQILAIIWAFGALAMLVYGALSYIQMKRRVATAVRHDGNVFESDAIRSPFVLGFLKPRIYIPFGLAETPLGYILAHERHHIARRDYITKLMAFITLALHWFNPLVWLAFLLFSKDMEMSCDEHVLRSAEASAKREYSLSMLSVAVNRRFPVPSPVAFGETGVRGRIKNVLRFRRPKRWVTISSALLCVLIVASCATNPLTQFSPSAPPPVINGTEMPSFYPDHTDPNEADYKTILADPSLLKEGKSVLAVWEPTVTWSERTYDQSSKGYTPYGFDMRSCDMTGIDITSIDYNKISFDSHTIWPKKLPNGFNPKRFLEFNKNPGLGIDDLHKQGITGEGVGIAIIGNPLPSGHEEYSSNLRYYERIHYPDELMGLGGAYLAGTAVGQDTGVAPGADLYYIATLQCHIDAANYVRDYDMTVLADCILRVLEINRQLPEDRKIRVIALNGSYNLALTQFADEEATNVVRDAIAQAERENVFVLTTDTDDYFKDFQLAGAGCTDYLSDPDAFDSYQLSEQLNPTSSIMVGHLNKLDSNMIIVPAWGHTMPGVTGETDYMLTHFEYPGIAPSWMAGFYALCCQVKPELTIHEFIDVIQKTGVVHKEYVGTNPMDYGKMINPAGVIAELKNK